MLVREHTQEQSKIQISAIVISCALTANPQPSFVATTATKAVHFHDCCNISLQVLAPTSESGITDAEFLPGIA
jgi:hypothetical protein